MVIQASLISPENLAAAAGHVRGRFRERLTRSDAQNHAARPRRLAKLGVTFTLHTYDYDPDADSIGLQAAEALGVEPAAC